jgi:potassium large conductance calcium-activated channel subfamily M alpha protein 1
LIGGRNKFKKPIISMIVDLAFASNVRFLDDHELYMDNVELYRTLPFASGQALARGILDSLMSTTYFNASALRLIRSWVTGGATIELELALAEGAGLRGGYSTPDSLMRRDRFKMERIELKGSVYDHLATGGYTFGDLFGEGASKYGMLCIGLYRLKGPDFGINPEDMEDDEKELRVVLTAPHKDLTLEEEDIAFMLVQYEPEPDDES